MYGCYKQTCTFKKEVYQGKSCRNSGNPKLQNDYLKQRSEENILAYKKQRNFCVTLLRKKKADSFDNLDLNLVRDIKMFWKTISLCFVHNPKKRSQIMLVDEKGNTLSEDEKILEAFNKFFGNIIKNLNIFKVKFWGMFR